MKRTFLFSCAIVISACAKDSTPYTFHRDIKPIFYQKCTACHVPGGIAPFSLTTYAELYPYRERIAIRVREGTMPPWFAEPGSHPFRNDPSLTLEEKEKILSWVEHGAPEGDPAENAQLKPFLPTGLSRVDLTVTMAEEYTPTLYPDDYRCFILNWPLDVTRYVAGIRLVPGNARVVHHAVVYFVTETPLIPDLDKKLSEWENKDPLYGYTCFGGPSGESQQYPFNLLGTWVPGFQAGDFPAGTGIPVPPGARLILQIHYNTLNGKEPDRSRVEFHLEERVERPAAYLPFLNPLWPALPASMLIPRGEESVIHSVEMDPRSFWSDPEIGFGPWLDLSEGYTIHGVLMHMHLLGTGGKVSIRDRGSSAEDLLLKLKGWDFHWQMEYWFEEPVRVDSSKNLYLECQYNNSEEFRRELSLEIPGFLPEPVDVTWGEGSTDEMCVANLYVTAR